VAICSPDVILVERNPQNFNRTQQENFSTFSFQKRKGWPKENEVG